MANPDPSRKVTETNLRDALASVDSFVSLAIKMIERGSPTDTVIETLRGVVEGSRAALEK